ncbi:hypothetical protein [Vreelandella sulfidaeris]|uniref:hypothetical protein n=1 Tax=Vreelandella sulfidaeris TaxID=115553 RepID=UPI0035E540BB
MTAPSNCIRATTSNIADQDRLRTGRRRFIKAAGSGLLAATLPGCAAPLMHRGRSLTAGQRVELLYLADTLESLTPTRIAAPATYLGPASLIGTPPWATARSVATLANAPSQTWQSLTLPSESAQRLSGGYGALAARLEQLRESLGSDRTLTLENGQCWNGSGLGHLSNGRAGVAASRLLGSDARVSSDERVLWPQQAAALYRDYGQPVLGSLAPAQKDIGAVPASYFTRGGARVAVVGATDPNAFDESRDLDVWYQALVKSVEQAAEQADLVILLADTGSASARWLAERLPAIDLVLAARGLDFWPGLIEVARQDGRSVPLCLPGSHGMGCYQLSATSDQDGWRFEARFHLTDNAAAGSAEFARAQQLQARFNALRAPYTEWLDLRLATAPDWLWRRDTVGGTWDGLMAAALAEGGEALSLLPGLRYDPLVAPGEPITRDHLLRLTGGHAAKVISLQLDSADLKRMVEDAIDNSIGTPLVINNSQDLPRLFGANWELRYGADAGERALINAPAGTHRWLTFSAHPQAAGGEALWQRMERYLLAQQPALRLPPRPAIETRYLEGHPGWHPESRLT